MLAVSLAGAPRSRGRGNRRAEEVPDRQSAVVRRRDKLPLVSCPLHACDRAGMRSSARHGLPVIRQVEDLFFVFVFLSAAGVRGV